MSQPKRLVVTYEDGSTKEADFTDLDGELRLKLAQVGLCPPLDRVGAAKHYLLVRWQDGWQEVFGVDKESVELLRYFVIERIEDRGRLSLDIGCDYPQLFVIERVPRKVVEALIVSDRGCTSYGLEAEVERWEGIYEDGGKKEYVRYDKTSDAYPHHWKDDSEAWDALTRLLHEELEKKNLSAASLLALDEPARIAEYKELAGLLGIRGGRKQEDVYGLLEMLVRRQEGSVRP